MGRLVVRGRLVVMGRLVVRGRLVVGGGCSHWLIKFISIS